MPKSSSFIQQARRMAAGAYDRIAPVFESPERSRWLPADSRVFGPPRRWSHSAAYCRSRGFEWTDVIPAQRVVRQQPNCVNYSATKLLKLAMDDLPAAGVARIRNARIASPAGWVIADDDTFLPDHSWYSCAIQECPIYKRRDLGTSVRMPGLTLNLCTDWHKNYAHTLFDALSRIFLFEEAGFRWADVTRVLIPDLTSEGKRAAAALCGLPMDKTVMLGKASTVECEELIAPSFPGVRRNTPPWVPTYWRSKLTETPQRGRRLYISRRGSTRDVTNEEELMPVLAAFGFQIILSGEEPLQKEFADADIIVGPHGAALGDVVFCRAGSVLIELTPPGHVYPYYYTAADSAGMAYFSIMGTYPTNARTSPMVADFAISPAILRDTLADAVDLVSQHRL